MIAVFEARCSIIRAIEAELYFYSRVYGITLADPVQPIAIHHLDGS